jgi:hypothetical protein
VLLFGFFGCLGLLLTVIDGMWANPVSREFVKQFEQRIWITSILGYLVMTLVSILWLLNKQRIAHKRK